MPINFSDQQKALFESEGYLIIENFIDEEVTWFLKRDFKYFKVYLDKTVLVKTNKKN